MLENGYIKLFRSILRWRWWGNPTVLLLWIYILLCVNIVDNDFEDITVKRGQLVTSIDRLSRETFLSPKQVRNALKKLKSTNEISIQTTNRFTVITVNKFSDFQSNNIDIKNDEQIVNLEKKYQKRAIRGANEKTQDFPTVKANNYDDFYLGANKWANEGQTKGKVGANEGQQYKKNKKDNKKNKKERGSETLPNATPTPTLSQIVDFCFENSLRVNPNKFYYYYENAGWKGVNNWQMKLFEWNETERPTQSYQNNKIEKPQQTEDYSFDLDEYEKQLRQTPSLDCLD